ncbi:TrmH family RNA methyltransferase [Aureibacter tunicatorum]|uniref:tRNA G18 (Ribose-2'-O)-methylase SpoU n=1 Tax=Aureibacter tunicatorum TaxID=866807 RepID=A0AAE3XMB4_9BACT|nr:TrmH family RNA methyltransferase [Aureibacter tunicatorum]MDR6237589.1 tRNA G18 (ribose-2'-O)-methylase SpoU [Aureibacter tunicatorum]BDD02623.1 tRNA/rRNA methyltransferase [Aureibacter tunicatorum]
MRKLKNEELDRISVEEFKTKEKKPVVIVLDNVRSLNNVGSAFRTGDAFLVEKILLCGITGTPPHRDIHKTALGAQDSVAWEYHDSTSDALKSLRSEGFKILSVEQADQSVSLDDFTPSKGEKYALVFGNEVFGVEEEVVASSDQVIEIPQYGTKHSLNISVSMGIVLWDVIGKIKNL